MDVIINGSLDDEQQPPGSALSNANNPLLNYLNCLGYDPENPPAAAIIKQSHDLPGNWVILSPMHWQATHNDAMVVAAGDALEIDDSESRFWFTLFADYLAEEGLTLCYHDMHTWLLRVDMLPPLQAKPVLAILDKSLMPELALLDSTLFWSKFITESQMFFASQPRATRINGLWAWGGAPLEEPKSFRVCAVDSFLGVVNSTSTSATLYNPDLVLKNYDILLINTLDDLSPAHQVELKKQKVNWYWNNIAYQQSNPNWIVRLWRKLSHAH